ncbi:MAG TPA: TonB-dependent receptor, partial [Saprospiraceae bacterium]|nr:TonB-dependent receptor [Saprospiraceae bacterium]
DQDESFQASGAYLSYSAKLSKWEMLLSTRYELINISLTDNFLVNGDQSGKRNFQPATGSLRLGYNVSNAFYLGAAMLSGFETPTLTEIINNPDGLGFAPIDPAFTKGIELMTEIRNKDVTLKFSVYDYASSNELIPYQLTNQQGRIFYRNGGKSNRKGIEVESKCRSSNWLETVISGNLNKFLLNENSTYIDSKIIAGIPQSAFKIGFIVSPNSSSSIMADMIYNGSIYADQNNEVKIDPQHGLHIHGQHIFKFKKLELIPSLGGRFMISHLNYNNILINAVGNRYYEPMSRVSWYAKIVCSFKK